jgi:(R,R)-butanediol dehydrogenase/meso-butanediol dehydrogenase/diacetyl reductase
MRVAVVNLPGEPFTIEERPIPDPGEGEVVIRIGRCGICGSDVNMTSGHSCEGFGIPPGSLIGHEWAGEVVALGPGVTRVREGDIVAGVCGVGCGQCRQCIGGEPLMCSGFRGYIGGFAEYMLGHERAALVLPQSLSLGDGALVEPLAVSLHGVRAAGIEPDSRVLVLGAGSIGLGAMFWAQKMRPRALVAASRSPGRAEMALAMGADRYVTTGEDEAARIEQALGGPPDIVIEAVGATGILAKCLQLVRPHGTVVSLGFCTQPDGFIPALACMKQIKLIFPVVYTLSEFEQVARVLDRDSAPDPRMLISETISLDAFPAKIEELRGRHAQTKVHVDPWAGGLRRKEKRMGKVAAGSSLEDVRALARRNLPGPIFDMIDAGAGNQVTARRNVDAFDGPAFLPRVGVDVSEVDLSATLMGAALSFPLVVAPMGALGVIDPEAELDLARAASDAGVLFTLSNYSTRSLEEVAKVCPGPKIFQVYMLSDEVLAAEYLQLAKANGYCGIAITIDTAAQQIRDPFERWNIFGIGDPTPWKTRLEFARRPGWLHRQRRLKGPSTDVERRAQVRGATLGPKFHESLIRKDVGWEDIARVAARWDGPVAVKGVLTVADARRAVDAGATAIVVCNHGGIIMDGAPPSLELVSEIRAALGDKVEIIQSGGLRRGSGIAKALALGADACMTGRPFAYGLAAGGRAGAAYVINLLRRDFDDVVRLCGCRDLEEVKQIALRTPQQSGSGRC